MAERRAGEALLAIQARSAVGRHADLHGLDAAMQQAMAELARDLALGFTLGDGPPRRLLSWEPSGNSIPLALAALGLLRVPSSPIEVRIAVSILVSAAQALRSQGAKP